MQALILRTCVLFSIVFYKFSAEKTGAVSLVKVKYFHLLKKCRLKDRSLFRFSSMDFKS